MKNANTPAIAAAGGPHPKSADINVLARFHGPEALQVMVGLMNSEDEKIALAAAREVLIRAYGKPDQPLSDESGPTVVVVRETLGAPPDFK